MTAIITKDNLFRATRSKAETKAQVTDNAARAIIDAEVDSREAKTERLRQARMKMEADQAETAEAAPAKKTRAKAKPATKAKAPAKAKAPGKTKAPAKATAAKKA